MTYFFFPETTGRSLEEVDEIFLKSTSIFDTVKISLELPRQSLSKFGVAIKVNAKTWETTDATLRVQADSDIANSSEKPNIGELECIPRDV